MREGRVLQRAEGGSRNGKRKRGAAGWWWPASRRSPGGTTSSTPSSRPSWPTRSGRKHLSHSSTLSIDNENRHYELWSSLNLLAFKDNQDQGGHERGGVKGHDAGALQVHDGEDGRHEEERTVNEYLLPVSVSDKDNVSDNILREDNVSVPRISNVAGETGVLVVMGS